jgi:hypothetical protein
MKSFLRTFVLTGLPYGIFMGIYFGFERGGIKSGLFLGSICGIVFGLIMAAIVRIQENRAIGSPPVLIDEVLLRDGRASHTKGRRGQSGRLYVTNKQILFEAFPPNKPAYRVSIPVHEVAGLNLRKRFGVFTIFLDVLYKDGNRERFVTDDVGDWIHEISQVRQNYLDTSRSEENRLFT